MLLSDPLLFPPAMNPPYPGAESPKKTNWWLLGCGGCLGLILLAAIGGALLFMGVLKVVKSSGPYQTAVDLATKSPDVQAELGTPITTGFFPMGNVSTHINNGVETGAADLTIPLKGPKDSGSLHYSATNSGKEWKISDFTLTVKSNGKVVPLNHDRDLHVPP